MRTYPIASHAAMRAAPDPGTPDYDDSDNVIDTLSAATVIRVCGLTGNDRANYLHHGYLSLANEARLYRWANDPENAREMED